MSLKNKALTSVFWTGMQQFSGQGVRFVISVIMARLLAPEDFGVIAMLGIFMGIGNAMVDSGMASSLIRSEKVDEADYSTVFYFNLIISILLYLIFFFSAPAIALFFEVPIVEAIIKVYAISFIVSAFNTVQLARMTRDLDFKTQFVIELPSIVISGFVGIYMAYTGYGVWSLVYSVLTQNVVKAIQVWFWSSWRPAFIFSVKKFKTHFNYGYKLLLAAILEAIYSNSYAIVISKFFPLREVGFFQRAEGLKQLPVSNLTGVLNKVAFPLFSVIQEDLAKLKDTFVKISRLATYVIAPVLFIAGGLGSPLFLFLLTEKWLPAVPYFQILCLGGVLIPVHMYNLVILRVKGYSSLYLKLEVAKKVLGVIVIIISLKWGILGLVWGNSVISVLALAINTFYAQKIFNHGFLPQLKSIGPIILVALCIGVGVYQIDTYLALYLSLFTRLLLGTFIGVTVYVLTCELLRIYQIRELLALLKRNK